MRYLGILALALAAAACSDGSGSGAANPAASPAPAPASAPLQLVFDGAAGVPYSVHFDVAAAVLERGDGAVTNNLLAAPQRLALVDAAGGARGLALAGPPAGDYTQLHLWLAAGSGLLVRADGSTSPVDADADLIVPIAGRLSLSGAPAWLAVGSLGGDQLLDGAPRPFWRPQFAGRLDESTQVLAGLVPERVDGIALVASWPEHGASPLRIEFAVDCVFADARDPAIAGRNAFLAALGPDDEVAVDGALLRGGVLYAHAARSAPRRYEPRLHGRVVAVGAGEVLLRVEAEELAGRLRVLPTPYEVAYELAGAWIHECGSRHALAPSACGLGVRVCADVAARSVVGGVVRLRGDEVAVVPAAGAPLQLEWHAEVVAVDLAQRRIAVAALPFVPLVVGGVPSTSADILIPEGCSLLRRELLGQGHYAIALEGVQPGIDRIWWRGAVIAPGVVEAFQVRVRTR